MRSAVHSYTLAGDMAHYVEYLAYTLFLSNARAEAENHPVASILVSHNRVCILDFSVIQHF